MNKYLRKSLYIGLSVLMISGLGVSISNVYASINPNRYGIDVFPSKKTHDRFAYQLRRHGHNSRVYYATKDSRLGRAIFNHGNPNIDYANYMDRYHHSWYNTIAKRLEDNVTRHHAKAKKASQKIIRKHRSVINRTKRNKRVKRYNHKVRVIHKRIAKKQRRHSSLKVLKSYFKQSNNRRLLKRSGFEDDQNDPKQLQGATFIFNKYAPNDKRAVVPKNFKETNWLKGKVGQLNPTAYYYKPALHGWIQLK